MKTRQKSERSKVPKSGRKPEARGGNEPTSIGTAAPVKQRTWQLGLPLGTAEERTAQAVLVDDGMAAGLSVAEPRATPKPRGNEKKATTATMEEVCGRLTLAFQKVASNKGAPGPDGQTVDEVRKHWSTIRPTLATALMTETYEPGNIRRVWIPKSDGSKRGLGIPDVVDRVVQEATRQVLEPVFEPTFHDGSHGFRSGRSCHTAIAAAREYVNEGYEWVVDIDLEKFFDKVNHQRLMARLARRVGDRRLLVLIGRMLKAHVVMPDGVLVRTDEGVPQGGPLSPLLSNIVLSELDEELAERGHRFVRYADDCNIYVRSERAGARVMASVKDFIERRLRLKVNADKSAVARPEERHFLGFRLKPKVEVGETEVLLSKRSLKRIDEKIREMTPRTWGRSLIDCIQTLNVYLVGWMGFFGICTGGEEQTLNGLDARIRRRLRAIQLAHWKTKRTIVRRLKHLGVKHTQAYKDIYGGQKSRWALSHVYAVDRGGLPNAYFAKLGLFSLLGAWNKRTRPVVAPVAQLRLPWG